MKSQRRKERQKRYRNRRKIAIIIFTLAVVVSLAGWWLSGKAWFYGAALLPLAIAYFIAAQWEKKELKK